MSFVAVSVIVPVFNRRDVIGRAVESLLTQDFREPFEIIVVDDGSSDGSAEVVAGFDERVRVVRQNNRGAAAARRHGIEVARAEVVAFLDSDDVAESYYLSSLWERLRKDDDVVLAYGRVAKMNGQPFVIYDLPTPINGVLHDPLLDLIKIGCFTCSMNLMTSRKLSLIATQFRSRFVAANDYDFAIQIALHGRFAFVDRVTIRCDRRPDGISASKRPQQAAFQVLAMYDGVRGSGRIDQILHNVLRKRLERLWPYAFVGLIRIGQLRLALEVAGIGLRYVPFVSSLRYLYWSWNHHTKAG